MTDAVAKTLAEIRLLQAAYNLNGYRLSPEALAETFAIDGVLEGLSGAGRGKRYRDRVVGWVRLSGARSSSRRPSRRRRFRRRPREVSRSAWRAARDQFSAWTRCDPQI